MASIKRVALFALPILSTLVAAAPTPQFPGTAQPCYPDYEVISQTPIDGEEFFGGTTCPGGNGDCELDYFTSYEVGYSIEVGLDLGLDISNILSGGISFAVTESTASSTQTGGSVACPEGAWTCALTITPKMVRVSGTVAQCEVFSSTPSNPQDYTVDFPLIVKTGTQAYGIDICSCPNKLAWADDGAPWPCPFDCP